MAEVAEFFPAGVDFIDALKAIKEVRLQLHGSDADAPALYGGLTVVLCSCPVSFCHVYLQRICLKVSC